MYHLIVLVYGYPLFSGAAGFIAPPHFLWIGDLYAYTSCQNIIITLLK